jgi:uncharacterized membrane protein YhaH (DUF805 family)
VLVLVYPAVALHIGRLHDMGRSPWLTLVPAVLSVLAMLVWAQRVSLGSTLDAAVPVAALVACTGLAAWCCRAPAHAEANSV